MEFRRIFCQKQIKVVKHNNTSLQPRQAQDTYNKYDLENDLHIGLGNVCENQHNIFEKRCQWINELQFRLCSRIWNF